jgi:hypothetical protein
VPLVPVPVQVQQLQLVLPQPELVQVQPLALVPQLELVQQMVYYHLQLQHLLPALGSSALSRCLDCCCSYEFPALLGRTDS